MPKSSKSKSSEKKKNINFVFIVLPIILVCIYFAYIQFSKKKKQEIKDTTTIQVLIKGNNIKNWQDFNLMKLRYELNNKKYEVTLNVHPDNPFKRIIEEKNYSESQDYKKYRVDDIEELHEAIEKLEKKHLKSPDYVKTLLTLNTGFAPLQKK